MNLRRIIISFAVLIIGVFSFTQVATTAHAAQIYGMTTDVPNVTIETNGTFSMGITVTIGVSTGIPASGKIWVDSANLGIVTTPFYTNTAQLGAVTLDGSGHGVLTNPSNLQFTSQAPYKIFVGYQPNPTPTNPNPTPVNQSFSFSVLVNAPTPSTPPATTSAAATTTKKATTVASGGEVSIPNPIKCADATCLIGQVIKYILGVIAIIATFMFVWGGIMMLTSGGNADQVKKARETLVWATIGIIVILLSWAVIRFVLTGLVGATKK